MSETQVRENISRRGNGEANSDYYGIHKRLYQDTQMQVMPSNCGGYMIHVRNPGNGEIYIPKKKLEEIAMADMDRGVKIFEGLCEIMGRKNKNISGEHVVGALTKFYFSNVLGIDGKSHRPNGAD